LTDCFVFTTVVAETAERTGSWYDVMQMYHPEETHGEVTAIYLTHGVAPKQAELSPQ